MTCRKMTYETRAEALKDIKVILAARKHFNARTRCNRNAKDNKKLRPYECPICGKYHLTSLGKLKYGKTS